MITPNNLVRHELTGLLVKVADSKNPANKGIEGTVVNETRNTLVIETRKGEKTLLKGQCTFIFELPGGEKVKVDGEILVARPEDRLKKKLKSL
jgi:ribonuclease P protein subunit POP4